MKLLGLSDRMHRVLLDVLFSEIASHQVIIIAKAVGISGMVHRFNVSAVCVASFGQMESWSCSLLTTTYNALQILVLHTAGTSARQRRRSKKCRLLKQHGAELDSRKQRDTLSACTISVRKRPQHLLGSLHCNLMLMLRPWKRPAMMMVLLRNLSRAAQCLCKFLQANHMRLPSTSGILSVAPAMMLALSRLLFMIIRQGTNHGRGIT